LSGATLFALAADVQAVDPERVYWSYNKHFYQSFSQPVRWSDAQANCKALGAHLVTVTSDEESSFVNQKVNPVEPSYWLGLSDSVKEGKFVWVTGEKFIMDANFYGIIFNYNGPTSDYFSRYYHFGYSIDTVLVENPYICEWSTNDYIGTAIVPDLNGNGSSEIAALYVDYVTLKPKVKILDPKTDTVISTLTFNSGLQAPLGIVALADINGNGVPEIGVLYLDNGQPTVGIKDAKNDTVFLPPLLFLSNAFNVKWITASPDANGNGSSEITVLGTGTGKQTNASKVETRDSSTGELLDDTNF